MKTLPAPVTVERGATERSDRPPWARLAVVFITGVLLGSFAVGLRGSSPPVTTAVSAPETSTSVEATSTTTAASTTTTAQNQPIPLATALRTAPFDAETYVDDGDVVVPLVFPDGWAIELIYAADLELSALGLTAGVSGAVGDGPLREITLVPLPIARIEWPDPPLQEFDTGRTVVRLYPADGGRWLAFGFRGWTALVSDPDSEPMSPEEQAAWVAGLDAHRVASGFLVLEASPPVHLARAGEPGGPIMTFGDEAVRLVTVRTGSCPVDADAVLCFPDLPVYLEASSALISELATSVRIRNVGSSYAAEVWPVFSGSTALSAVFIGDVELSEAGTLISLGWAQLGPDMQGALRSVDGGATWTRQLLPDETRVVNTLVSAAGGQILATTIDWDANGAGPIAGGVWRSDDDGLSWTHVPVMPVPEGSVGYLTAAATRTGEVFVLGQSCAGGECRTVLLGSTDGGETFGDESVVPTPPFDAFASPTLSIDDGETLVVRGSSCRPPTDEPEEPLASCAPFLMVSGDAGTTWNTFTVVDLAPGTDPWIHSVAATDDESLLAAGQICQPAECRNALWVSDSDGQLHEVELEALDSGASRVFVTPGGALVAIGPGSTAVLSTDVGATWEPIVTPPGATVAWVDSVSSAPDGNLYLTGFSYSSFMWRSSDDGRTWVAVVAGEG